MKKTYAAVVQQIEELKVKAEGLKRAEVAEVVGRIKEAIQVYGLTANDLFSNGVRRGRPSGAGKSAGATSKSQGKSPVKRKASGKRLYKSYSDGAGNTWSGHGPRPKWLKDALAAGKDLADLVV